MALNEKVKTEDVVEILDTKIITSQGHPALGVVPREPYDSVLTKLETQVLTPEQKAAFDAAISAPGPSNPVVLKKDLDTYVPSADLGEFRDSVQTFADLPNAMTLSGTLTNGSNVVTGISYVAGLTAGKSVTGLGISSGTTVVEVYTSNSSIKMSQPATQSGATTLTFQPVLGELRGVLDDRIIYRYNGSSWVAFISTGTLKHNELTASSMNASTDYQHLTLTEKTNLLNQSHAHANKAILDQITSLGSGQIITTEERNRIPTQTQKDALIGSSGTPSSTNPYVTTQDPRLNTVRNPYVTVGPPGSLATFQGVDFRPFEDAVQSITVGAAAAVKAIEVLPGFYTLGGVPIRWQTQNNSILIENFTPGTAILSFQTFAAGIQALLPGTGQLVVRGFTFELNDLGTSGILTERPNSIIENCIFQPGPTTSNYQVGITIGEAANNTVIRRCLFRGPLEKGIVIKADNCRVEECKFSLTNATHYGVEVMSTASYSFVNHCHFINARLKVGSGAINTQITGNHFSTTTGILNDGFNTRILENLPQEVNQPFLGKKRTVGLTESYADYRGNDHVPFIEALADPNVSEIEVLPGTYQFSTSVTLPVGKSIRGVSNGNSEVTINGLSSVNLFNLSNYSKLENLNLIGLNASLVKTNGTVGVCVENCTLTLTAVDGTDDYEVSASSVENMNIVKSKFYGSRGLYISGSSRSTIRDNTFDNNLASFFMSSTATCSRDKICGNVFEPTTPAPLIAGTNSVISSNHFSGSLPTKLATIDTVWQSNWPHHQANNETGVDDLVFSLDKYLEPLNSVRSFIEGIGTIAFSENQDTVASTSLIKLSARLNRALGYQARLYWLASLTTGSVSWRITTVFRDQVTSRIGIPVSKTVVSPRTKTTSKEDDMALFSWSNLEFGLPSDVVPTHVSITVERVGASSQDTLATDAHLVEVELTLPRD